jgi:signal transduction histidine kinase
MGSSTPVTDKTGATMFEQTGAVMADHTAVETEHERPTGAAWPGLRTLRLKLVIAGALWVAIVIGVLTAAGFRIAENRLEEDLRNTAHLTALAIADDIELRTEPFDDAATQATMREFRDAAPTVRDIALFTTEEASRDPLASRALRTGQLLSEDRSARLTAVATPILRDGRPVGVVLVTASLEPIVRLRNEGRLFAAAIAIFAIVGVTILINVLLAGLERQHARMREELWRARELATVGQTMANVAHQVGTPLNLVSAHVQLLQQELAADANAQRRLGVIAEQVERVIAAVRELLNRARPDAKARLIALKPVLTRLADGAQVLAASQGVRVALDVPDDLPLVAGNEVQLELAITNLVTNALDAMPRGGHLTVSAAARGPGVVLEVKDTGPGMPADLVARAFEPWVTTKPPGRGTGLGLSIARDVVQRASGAITVETPPGGGTVFRVTLPAAS